MKKKAIVKISLISIVAILAIVFSFLSFKVAGKNYEFVGFANAINKGIEYDGGIFAEYKAEKGDLSDDEFNKKFDDTIVRVESVLSAKDLNNLSVYKTNNNTIRIESANSDVAKQVLELIGQGELKIRTSSDSSKDAIILGKNVVSTFATQLQTSSTAYQWGAYILFDDEGKSALSEATKNASSSSPVTIYMFRGDSETSFFSLQISEKVSQGFMFISSSSMTQSYAESLAMEMYCGSLPVNIETIGNVGTITVQNYALIGLAIAFAIMALVVLVLFIVRYREFGLMACVSFVLFVGLTLFILQAISIFEISIAGVAGLILSLILFASSIIIVFENVKREYALGKKMPASVKTAFNKCNSLILDISVVFAVLGLLCFLIGTQGLKSFGLAIIICSILSIVISLFITRVLLNSYLAFNSTNNKRVNLNREEEIDEIG